MPDGSRLLSYPSAAVTMSLVGALALVALGREGPVGEPGVPAEPVMEAPSGAASEGSPAAEGIKVHGHWTIEVREPDGELVERREFENALVQTGGLWLARVLGRELSVGRWEIRLDEACGTMCQIVQDPYPDPFDLPNIFHTLEISTSNGTLRLEGTATPHVSGAIGHVGTVASSCDGQTSPSNCAAGADIGDERGITETVIESVPVEAGQLIVVRVDISFS